MISLRHDGAQSLDLPKERKDVRVVLVAFLDVDEMVAAECFESGGNMFFSKGRSGLIPRQYRIAILKETRINKMGTADRSEIRRTLVAGAKTLFHAVQRAAIGLACIAAIALGLYLAYQEKVSAASACFTVGIILFLLSNIELFESIKAPGIHATMRKIDSKVREVEVLADNVAKTSTVTAEFCMEVMSRIGRWSDPIPREQALNMVKNLSHQLLALGVEHTKVQELLEPWRNVVLFEILRPAHAYTGKRLERLRLDFERSLSPQTLMDSPEYKHYMAKIREIGDWSNRLQSALKEPRPTLVRGVREVFQEVVDRHGTTDFENHDRVPESLRQAEHFAKTGEFLDVGYWLALASEESNY